MCDVRVHCSLQNRPVFILFWQTNIVTDVCHIIQELFYNDQIWKNTIGLKIDPGWRRAWTARLNCVSRYERPPTIATIAPLCGRIATRAVNEALNGLLIAEEDYNGLKTSIDAFDCSCSWGKCCRM